MKPVNDVVESGVRKGCDLLFAQIKSDVELSILTELLSHTIKDGQPVEKPYTPKPITWTGQLFSSLNSSVSDDSWTLSADAFYADLVDQGDPNADATYHYFYENETLTAFGRWAIQKAGFTETGDEMTLIWPDDHATMAGKRTRGSRATMSGGHPYIGENSTAYKKAMETVEQVISEAIRSELIAEGYVVG